VVRRSRYPFGTILTPLGLAVRAECIKQEQEMNDDLRH